VTALTRNLAGQEMSSEKGTLFVAKWAVPLRALSLFTVLIVAIVGE
jgi:hypothetical protein